MLEVYYEKLQYFMMEENVAYGVGFIFLLNSHWNFCNSVLQMENLLADWGATLGLFLGFSMITIIELGVFIGFVAQLLLVKWTVDEFIEYWKSTNFNLYLTFGYYFDSSLSFIIIINIMYGIACFCWHNSNLARN